MNDYDRGAYTPHNDAPLSFDARQSRGRRGFPTTLVISLAILVGLGAAIFMFYRSGVRGAGEAPVPVGVPVGQIKAPAPADKAAPEGEAAGLQIYKSEAAPAAAPSSGPVFAAGPEQPQPRPAPKAPVAVAPVVTHAVPAPAASSPAMVAASGATTKTAPAPPAAAKTKPAPAAAPGDAIGDLLHAKAPVPAKPAPATPAAAPPVAQGAAVVQIGAYSSTALAAKGWSDIASAYGPQMAGKGKIVEPVAHDGKTLFRTSISGFGSRADAVAFCVKLKADGHACIVK
jgi:hypothetical protein